MQAHAAASSAGVLVHAYEAGAANARARESGRPRRAAGAIVGSVFARWLRDAAAGGLLSAACAALLAAGRPTCARGGWLAGAALLPLSRAR